MTKKIELYSARVNAVCARNLPNNRGSTPYFILGGVGRTVFGGGTGRFGAGGADYLAYQADDVAGIVFAVWVGVAF
jgi:hypothetical protein